MNSKDKEFGQAENGGVNNNGLYPDNDGNVPQYSVGPTAYV